MTDGFEALKIVKYEIRPSLKSLEDRIKALEDKAAALDDALTAIQDLKKIDLDDKLHALSLIKEAIEKLKTVPTPRNKCPIGI